MDKEAIDRLRREGPAIVFGVAGLATNRAFGRTAILGRLGFNDVGRRRLGRGRRILTGSRQLFAHREHLGRQCVKPGLQIVHLRLQPLTVATGFSCVFSHTRYGMSCSPSWLGTLGWALPRLSHAVNSYPSAIINCGVY